MTSGNSRADLVHQARPHGAGVDEHVGLVDQRELLARALLRTGEGVADDPLDAERRVEADLGGDLGGRAHADGAAVAGVGALGALADHHEVDLAGRSAQRATVTPGKIRDGRRLT